MMEKTQSLENTVNTISQKLEMKEEALKQKEQDEEDLRFQLKDYQSEIENKNKEIKELS